MSSSPSRTGHDWTEVCSSFCCELLILTCFICLDGKVSRILLPFRLKAGLSLEWKKHGWNCPNWIRPNSCCELYTKLYFLLSYLNYTCSFSVHSASYRSHHSPVILETWRWTHRSHPGPNLWVGPACFINCCRLWTVPYATKKRLQRSSSRLSRRRATVQIFGFFKSRARYLESL